MQAKDVDIYVKMECLVVREFSLYVYKCIGFSQREREKSHSVIYLVECELDSRKGHKS